MDIALIWDSILSGIPADIAVENDDLKSEEGLRTAVVISLATDARAKPEQTDQSSEDLRGYWADIDPASPKTGSLLWTLTRSKQVPSTLRPMEKYAREALQWMVDDGIAKSVSVVASDLRTGVWALDVTITKPDGTASNFRYGGEWDAEAARVD